MLSLIEHIEEMVADVVYQDRGDRVLQYNEFRCSGVTGCDNQIIAGKILPNASIPFSTETLIKFMVGNMLHEIIQKADWLSTELYLQYEYNGIQLSGHLDCLGIYKGVFFIVDIKSANKWSFGYTVKGGAKTGHIKQVTLYTKMFRDLYGIDVKKMVVLYVNKTALVNDDKLETFITEHDYDEEKAVALLNKLVYLYFNWITPKCLQENPNHEDWECEYCRIVAECGPVTGITPDTIKALKKKKTAEKRKAKKTKSTTIKKSTKKSTKKKVT